MLAGRIARETCQNAVVKVGGGGGGLVVTPMNYIASKEDRRGSFILHLKVRDNKKIIAAEEIKKITSFKCHKLGMKFIIH